MELVPGIDHAQLLALARRLVGLEDAEDVLQNAYLKAHRAERTFRSESRRTTWFYAITRRCAIDHLRARGRRPQEELTERAIPEGRPIADVIDDATTRMGRLPESARQTLLLRAAHETDAAAAQAAGISTQAFRSRLTRARTRLRSLR